MSRMILGTKWLQELNPLAWCSVLGLFDRLFKFKSRKHLYHLSHYSMLMHRSLFLNVYYGFVRLSKTILNLRLGFFNF